MRRTSLILAFGATLAACGSDIPSSNTAAISRANEASRLAAQEARIANPGVMACIRQVTTDDEVTILAAEDDAAVALLNEVLNREEMQQCLIENEVVIYI